jgi:carnitine-CoA ligase
MSHETWWQRCTIPEVLDHQVDHLGEQTFLVLAGRSITYRDLQEKSRRVASGLASVGIGYGDRVAIMMSPCPEWVVIWFAANRLGAVVVPVNTAYRGEFLANQLNDSRTTVLAVESSLLDRVTEVAPDVTGLRRLYVRDDTTGTTVQLGAAGVSVTDSLQVEPVESLEEVPSVGPQAYVTRRAEPAIDDGAQPDWKSPAAVFFSSGTTGRSKGALSSHHYLLSAAAAMVECWQLRTGEVLYAPLPLFHLSAVGSVLGPLLAGSTGVIDRSFSVTQTWDRVRELGASGIALAGPMLMMLWSLPADPGDQEIPIRFLSAAPVPSEIYHDIEKRYGCRIVTCYGLSEAFPVAYAGVNDHNPPGASGRANPRLDVAVVDADDAPVGAGVVGEIVCRPRESHVVFEGYDEKPAETLAQMGSLWFHTGDLGRFDESGNLSYVDRKKDSIRRRGENISSFEVEQVVLRHSAVAEAAAFGVPSDLGEDDVMVSLTLRPEQQLDMTEFMDFCADRMPYFAVPRFVDVVHELPKNVIGRVLKPVLRERGVTATSWDRDQSGYTLKR